jgi:hypothetical protein
MWPFTETQQKLEPAPAAPVLDRVEETHARLSAARAYFNATRSALEEFNRQHCAIVNGRRALRVPKINGTPDYAAQRLLESEQQALGNKYAAAGRTFQTALGEWSKVKLQMEATA